MQKIIFLGIVLDGRHLTLTIPEDKRIKAINMLKWVIDAKKVTILTVQRLTGTLNFLTKAIVPGRTFLHRMYDGLKLIDNNSRKLKQHHHITLTKGFIEDCKIWLMFLSTTEQSPRISRPFLDLNQEEVTSEMLQFYSDASASKTHGGMGAVFDDHWIELHWNCQFLEQYKPSIEFLELFALVAAILTWGEKLQNMRVRIFCDNKSVRDMINGKASTGSSSRCKFCMKLLEIIGTRQS